MNGPDPQILLQIYEGVLEMEENNPADLTAVELKTVKKGEYFYRKPTAKNLYIRNHYNRKSQFNSFANYSCTNDTTGAEIFLKPSTIVWID